MENKHTIVHKVINFFTKPFDSISKNFIFNLRIYIYIILVYIMKPILRLLGLEIGSTSYDFSCTNIFKEIKLIGNIRIFKKWKCDPYRIGYRKGNCIKYIGRI